MLKTLITPYLSEILAWSKSFVAIESISRNGGEKKLAKTIKNILAQHHINDITEYEFNPGQPNLIVKIPGRSSGKRLVLCGHFDTKPTGDLSSWNTQPFEPVIKNKQLFGRGAADMKGGLATMLGIAIILHKYSNFPGELILVFTSDEEMGSKNGANELFSHNLINADLAIICEPAGIDSSFENIYIGHRSYCVFTIEVFGRQTHSGAPQPNQNASLMAAELMNKFNTIFSHYLPDSILNIGSMIETKNGFYGMTPGTVKIYFDLRCLPKIRYAKIKKTIQTFMSKEFNKKFTYKINFSPRDTNWIEGYIMDKNEPIIKIVQKSFHNVFGKIPATNCYPAASEARFFHQAGIPVIAALGPGTLNQAHATNECLSVQDLEFAVLLYLEFFLN